VGREQLFVLLGLSRRQPTLPTGYSPVNSKGNHGSLWIQRKDPAGRFEETSKPHWGTSHNKHTVHREKLIAEAHPEAPGQVFVHSRSDVGTRLNVFFTCFRCPSTISREHMWMH
jgi:hypothetical protein